MDSRTLLADMNLTSVSIIHNVLGWYRPCSQKNWRTTSQAASTNHIWRKFSQQILYPTSDEIIDLDARSQFVWTQILDLLVVSWSNRTNHWFLQIETRLSKRQCFVKLWTCFQNEYWVKQALQRICWNTLHNFRSDDVARQHCWLAFTFSAAHRRALLRDANSKSAAAKILNLF